MFYIHPLLMKFGQLGVFIIMAAENMGLPLPTELGYVYEAALAKNLLMLIYLNLFITAGNLAGGVSAYWIGKEGDLALHKFIRKRKGLAEAHNFLVKWYDRYGSVTVFAARFIGYIRPWASFVAGVAEFPFWPFLIWTAVGTFLFNFIALWIADYIFHLWHNFPIYRIFILISGVILFALILVIYPLYKRFIRGHYDNDDGKPKE